MSDEQDIVRIATPVVSIEVIGKVTRGLYSFKKPASYKDLAALVGLHEVTVSQGFSAARDLGFVRPTGNRGVYSLTEVGENYARLLGFGKDTECRMLISKQVRELSAWTEIVSYLEMNRDVARDPLDLVMHVEQRLSKRWKGKMRVRLATSYKSILEYADLVKMENGQMISIMSAEDSPISDLDSIEDISDVEVKKPEKAQSYASLVSKARVLPDYAEFSIPEFFILFVKKNKESIDYLREQLAESSIFNSWLNVVETKLSSVEADTPEEGG